jgi:hypothetical protein
VLEVSESKRFFFEKKNQKTFVLAGVALGKAGASSPGLKEQKFFASFFQKRSASLPCFLAGLPRQFQAQPPLSLWPQLMYDWIP